MSRILATLLVAFGIAATANAATLTVTSDKSIYTVGENITLSVAGSSNGTTETDTAVFAQLNFDDVGTLTSFVSSSQVAGTSFGGGLTWTLGAQANGAGFAVAINQIANLSPVSAFSDATGSVVLSADAVGTVTASFEVSTADYFGAAAGAPASFTIVVPEPTTAGLLGLGLLSLAMAGRRH